MLPRRMPGERARLVADDAGTAVLEFVLAGLLLLVPVVYLVVALGLIQEQSLGAESGSRHIARAIATAPDAAVARERSEAVARSVAAEYGMDPAALRVSMSCRPSGACPRPGAVVIVTVRTRVVLPLVPPILGIDRLSSIPVEASSAAKASRLWGE